MNSTTVTGPATGPVAENRPPASPRVGMLPPFDLLDRGPGAAGAFLAQAAEAGIDHVCCGDHVSFFTGLGFDGLVQATALAMLHPALPIYSGVYLLPLRHPVLVARQLADIARLAPGRLIFGVGVGGENPKEFEACGIPHTERGARVTEGIDVVRTLWRDTPASFKGRFTEFAGVSIDPKPVQRPGPPIWVGGRSDAALKRAGRQGDGWVSYVVQPERYAQSLAKIHEAAEQAGRRLDGFVAAHLTFITVGRDYESAERTWVRILSRRYAQDFGPLARKYGVIGTPEQCAEQMDRFARAGCHYFVMNPIGDPQDEREQLEAIASEVIPRAQTVA
jgi:probable F420-dependent oxidoreductase